MPQLNLGRVRMVPKGEWDAATSYIALDVVSYIGASFLAVQNVPAGTATSDASYWLPLAQSGVHAFATRADAVAAIADGWTPASGVVYWIEGLAYVGRTGATSIADLPGLDPTVFATRAAAVAACADGWRAAHGVVYSIGGFDYIGSTGASLIGDLLGLVPHGDYYPDHWAENSVPGTTDMADAIQAALATKRPVIFRGGTYAVSHEIVINNGHKARGAGAHWKRRTGYVTTQGAPTVLKWIGADASNTAVVRISRKPVGEEATSITPPNGDDLVDFEISDIHVNCDNKARFGFYFYRCGNNSTVKNLTSEKARLRNIIMLGVYAGRWGHFGAYESESHGVSVGEDYFGWGSVESTCFAVEASFHLCNNGTNATYVKGTATDLAESGGIFEVGRGSQIRIVSEGNRGRACIIRTKSGSGYTDGATVIVPEYLEANGDGPHIRLTNDTLGLELRDGFFHPGNAATPSVDRFSGTLKPQDITIDATTTGGGTQDGGQVLRLVNLVGENQGVAFGITSDTVRYAVHRCPQGVVFTARRPGFGDTESIVGGMATVYVGASATGDGSGYDASNLASWADAARILRICRDVVTLDVSSLTSTSIPATGAVLNGYGLTREITIDGGLSGRINHASGTLIAASLAGGKWRFQDLVVLERIVAVDADVTLDACPIVRTGANASALAAVEMTSGRLAILPGTVVNVTNSTAATKKAVALGGGAVATFNGAVAGMLASFTAGHAITFREGAGMAVVSVAAATATWAAAANVTRETGGDAGVVIAGGVVNP